MRIRGHIGVDALVKFASRSVQRIIPITACVFCLGYAGLLSFASIEWITTLMSTNINVNDLGQFGIKQWQIAIIVPVGFALVFIRFLEILVRILRHQQVDLRLGR